LVLSRVADMAGQMEEFKRYAVYYAPPPGPLADFGASWLGWAAVAGAERSQPAPPGLPRPVTELTARPGKYGFHGTLKPPFRLAPGRDPTMLAAALAGFARNEPPLTLSGLRLARLGGFLALVPEGDAAPLAALAARVVADLDPFRASLTAAERARCGPGLSPRQVQMLERWGYPYVMEEFRFHLTLTGPLEPAEAEKAKAALAPQVAPLLPRPFRVDELCLFGEGADGRFRLLHRYALSG